MKVLVINGPNLNILEKREDMYGNVTLDEIEASVREVADELGIEVDFFQSNSEGDLINAVQKAMNEYDGLIINPGGYTHYSVSLRDALAAFPGKIIEVHLTNIFAREDYRRKTITGEAADCVISGGGPAVYQLALRMIQG